MYEDLMEYLEHIGQPYGEETADSLGLPDHNALLMLDSFKAHTTDCRLQGLAASVVCMSVTLLECN